MPIPPRQPLAPTILFSVSMDLFLFSFLLGSQQMALCPYVPTRVKYYMGLSPVVGHHHLRYFMWAHAHDFPLRSGPMQLSLSYSALRKSLASSWLWDFTKPGSGTNQAAHTPHFPEILSNPPPIWHTLETTPPGKAKHPATSSKRTPHSPQEPSFLSGPNMLSQTLGKCPLESLPSLKRFGPFVLSHSLKLLESL